MFQTEQEEKESPVEKRILGDLGLTWEDLRGKKVLDVGAGLGELAEVGKKHGVEIVSLDKFEGKKHEGGQTPPKDISFVTADAAHMPFSDNSFDIIISHAAVPSPSGSPEEAEAILSEARRVLKDEGEFRFGPGYLPLKPEEEESGPDPYDREKRAKWRAEKSLQRVGELGWDGQIKTKPDADPYKASHFILHKKKTERSQ